MILWIITNKMNNQELTFLIQCNWPLISTRNFMNHPKYLLSFFFLLRSRSFQLLVPMLRYSSMSQLRTEIFFCSPLHLVAAVAPINFPARFSQQPSISSRLHNRRATLMWVYFKTFARARRKLHLCCFAQARAHVLSIVILLTLCLRV